MNNAWKAQWEEGHQLFVKKFEGDKPTRAVDFGKKLKARGIIVVNIISARRAFPPPVKHSTPPQPGLLWCPYCLKWREFQEAEVLTKNYRTPVLLRCPVCTISVKDAYVRMYNPELVIQYEMRQEMRSRQREATKLKKKAEDRYRPRGGLRLRR
jgi:hypothetical protein